MIRRVSEVIAEDLFKDAPQHEWKDRRGREPSPPQPDFLKEWNPSDFTGLYHSEELQITWRLVHRDEDLVLTDWGDETYPLQLTAKDQLLGKPSWLKLKTVRDAAGRLTALEFGSGVPAGIIFKRYQ